MTTSSRRRRQTSQRSPDFHVGFNIRDTQGEVLPTISRCFLSLRSSSSTNMRGLLALFLLVVVLALAVESKDMLRKSIVFDKKTPDVFYCPQKKPKGVDKMLVRAKPLKKLCEFEGKPLPPDYKSDCYNDVDETEYACKEKHRIMKRMKKLEREIEKKETERASRSRRI